MSTNPLQALLGKLGVTYDNLNDEERATYAEWRKTLEGRSLTDEDVRVFLETEYHDTVKKLTNKSLKEREDTFLKMKVEMILSIMSFLDMPMKEKVMLEKQIATHT